jgi:hypothetical protein
MIRRSWHRTKGALGFLFALLLAFGCQHEGDAAAPTSPSPPGLDAADAQPLAEAGVAQEASAAEGNAATLAAGPPPDASPSPKPPAPNPLDNVVAPAYPASALHDGFQSAKDKLIACYLPGKKKDPKLRGKVIVKFTVTSNGTAKPVANEGSTLPDEDVIACVVRVVKTVHFAKPIEGTATVVFPLIFRPSDDAMLVLPDVGGKSP